MKDKKVLTISLLLIICCTCIFNVFVAEGYGEGYSDVYGIEYDYGYEDGYDYGYETGYDDGHINGYYEGYEDGYDRGYEDGYDERYYELDENSADETGNAAAFLLTSIFVVVIFIIFMSA